MAFVCACVCVCVHVPGRKAGGCPRTPAANNNTATESVPAAEGRHKHKSNHKKTLFIRLGQIVFKASMQVLLQHSGGGTMRLEIRGQWKRTGIRLGREFKIVFIVLQQRQIVNENVLYLFYIVYILQYMERGWRFWERICILLYISLHINFPIILNYFPQDYLLTRDRNIHTL